MKENDWLVAALNNQNYSTNDFILAGLTTENTQLLSPNEYKKSNYIRDKFTENGTFQESKFDAFYKDLATKFGQLQSADIKDTFMYDPFDPRSVGKKNIKSPHYSVELVANTNRETTMFSGQVFADDYSARERALLNQIFDTATNTWLDDTPNDRALVNSPSKWILSLFDDPLVYAKYDSEGEHYDQFTGRMVKHAKGEYKTNLFGTPYTETLNGRSLIGKEVVSSFDTITVDKEGIDKYNFFDSDDVDKSTAGTIAKAAAAIAPMLLGGPTAAIYSGVMVGREMMKTLPMLYGIASSWSDNLENATLNRLAGMALAWTGSTSDAGRSSVLNMETGANLITDVALQWGLQRIIAQGINKLRGTNLLMQEANAKAYLSYMTLKRVLEQLAADGAITREALARYLGTSQDWTKTPIGKAAIEHFTKLVQPTIESSRQLGADMSLAYMALVSNTDVYQSMLEAGASRKEAAAVTLGSTLGMFSVDKYMHLGETFFNDLSAEYEGQIRRTFVKEAESWKKNVLDKIGNAPKESELIALRKWVLSGIDLGKRATGKFAENLKHHTLGFGGKAFGEGLEEVSEELVTDVSKSLYELAGLLGFDTLVDDVGAWDNALQRYGMSFLGGALGGGLFYGIDLYQNGKFSIDLSQDELIYIARNGRTKEALAKLEDWHKKGKLGSTNLSIDTVEDSGGQKIFVTADANHESLNDFVYRRMKETITQLDNIINENDAKLSEDLLYEKMILSEARFLGLKDYLKDASYSTGYQNDFQNALNLVVNLLGMYDKAALTIDGRYSENITKATDELLRNLSEAQEATRKKNLKKLTDLLKDAQEHLANFTSGVYSAEYVEKMMFALDKDINQDFVAMTYDQWLKKKHDGKTPEELSDVVAALYKQEYLDYKKSAQSSDLNEKFAIYKSLKKMMDPILKGIQDNQEAFSLFLDEFTKLGAENSPLTKIRLYQLDDVLDFMGETEESESYKTRGDENLNAEREIARDEENGKLLEAYKNAILGVIDKAGGFIDPNSRRELLLLINNRNKDVVSAIVEGLAKRVIHDKTKVDMETGVILELGELSELDNSVLDLLKNVNAANAEATLEQIETLVKTLHRRSYEDYNRLQDNLYTYLLLAEIISTEEPIPEGEALQMFFDRQIADGKTVDEAIAMLTSKAPEDASLTAAEVAAMANDIRKAYEDGTLEDFDLSKVDVDEALSLDADVLEDLHFYSELFRDALDSFRSHPIILLNDELDARVKQINPVTDLVKALALQMNVDMNNLESLLTKLSERYEEGETIQDFILSSEEEETLEEAGYIFKLAKAYLNAAAARPNIFNPYGHNNSLNEFALNHKGAYLDFEELPVISQDVANMYTYELDRYMYLVGVLNEKTGEYNPASWRWLSALNKINKARLHIEADRAWNSTFYSFFKGLYKLKAFEFEFEGKTIDLLEGFESIPEVTNNTPDAAVYNNKVADLFYNNVLKLINAGWSYRLIWERSGLFTKILKVGEVAKQKTSSLDLNITVDRLTEYDKMIILLTTAGVESTKFYQYLDKRIKAESNIAPLTIQLWVSRVGVAYLESPEAFNETLSYLEEIAKTGKPIVFAMYAGGDAGAGKSSVCGKNIVSWLDTPDVWISAPKPDLVNNLFDAVGKGVKLVYRKDKDVSETLFDKISIDHDAYLEAMQHIQLELADSPYYSIMPTSEMKVVKVNLDKFHITKMDNAPKVLLIDEVTHLSSLELQILSAWAKVNGTALVFLGDDKQRGFSKLGNNIDREGLLTIRTPNLGISLRDNNALHQYNLVTVSNLIKRMLSLDADDPDYKVLIATVKSLLPSIHFKIYQGDDINGDLLTSRLTEGLVALMNGSIGYVGGNNATLLMLQRLKGDDVHVLTEDEIQGLEFDYVVIDKDKWNYPAPDSDEVDVLQFLQDVYTMISRGRNGSIIIDGSGLMSEALGKNKLENSKAKAQKISLYTEDFRLRTLEVIKKILSTAPGEGEEGGKKEGEEGKKGTAGEGEEGGKSGEGEDDFPKLDMKTDGSKPRPEEAPLSPEDFKMEDEDEALNTPEEILPSADMPMLVYGSATTHGFAVEVREGKEVWINKPGEVKRDGLIFAKDAEITSNLEQIDISNTIRGFKNSFLYNNGYDALPERARNLIDKEAYDNVKWFIVASPKDDSLDNFIRNIGYRDGVKPIGEKNLVFRVVGEFKLKDGSTAQITMGLMADPKTWIDGIPTATIPRINRKILALQEQLANMGLSKKLKDYINAKIKAYLDKLTNVNLDDENSAPRKYAAFISLVSELYKDAPVRIPIPRLITPGMTDLHRDFSERKKTSHGREVIERVRRVTRVSRKSADMLKNIDNRIATLTKTLADKNLRGIYKTKVQSEIARLLSVRKKVELIRDHSFHSLNPYTTVSPMYYYKPTNGAVGVDDSLVGRVNVVFVTNDPTLSPDNLMDLYLELKNAAAVESSESGLVPMAETKVAPKVRMVVLNPIGLSFLDMSNPYLQESMYSENTVQRHGLEYTLKQVYPFKTNFMGVRMYVGLWNFRANLLLFKDKLRTFVESLPIEESKLDEYLTVKDLLWRQKRYEELNAAKRGSGKEYKLSKDEVDYLEMHKNLEHLDEVSKAIDEFNDSLHDLVKQFRLGSSLTNGAYIRELTGDLSTFYDTTSKFAPSGIYLNTLTMNKYLGIVECIFTDILDEIVTCDYDKLRLLSTETDGKVKNSFANHITALANQNGKLEIVDSDSKEIVTVNFGSSYDPELSNGILNTFSHIPAVLSKAFKYTSIRQRHLNGEGFDVENDYPITITGTVTNSEGKSEEINKKIHYTRLWKYVDMIESADEYNVELILGYTFDPTLSNFFSFAFHGTLEGVDTSAQRATDALFPKGFFADPLSTTLTDGEKDSPKPFVRAALLTIFFGADVTVGDPIFYITTKDMTQGLESVKADDKKPDEKANALMDACMKRIDTTAAKYPQLAEAMTNLKEDLAEVSDENKEDYVSGIISEELTKITSRNYEGIFSRTVTPTRDMLVTLNGDEAQTLELALFAAYRDKYGDLLKPISTIQPDENGFVVQAEDITLKVTRGTDQTFIVLKVGEDKPLTDVVATEVNNFISLAGTRLDPATVKGLQTMLTKFTLEKDPANLDKVRQVLLKKLMTVSKTLPVTDTLHEALDSVINKLNSVNCI